MQIAGYQPLSLIDFPGKSAAIVFTQGCVFRCAFCHNPELIPHEPTTTIDPSVILESLASRTKMLDGLVITGGEPTLQPKLTEFIRDVKALGLLVKLDTNGVHPNIVANLFSEGLIDYVAMDLKHTWEKYDNVARTGSPRVIENCKTTLEMIQDSGIDHEFRTTVFPGLHTEKDFFDMVGYLKDEERYFIQETRFTKTLDPNLSHDVGFSVPQLVKQLKEAFPRITIEAR